MPPRSGVRIVGLRELVRDARRLGDRDGPREVRRALRTVVTPIAADARRRTSRSSRDRSGWKYSRHLADTIRPFVRGDVVGIRSPAPHAKTVQLGLRHPADTVHRTRWVTARAQPSMFDATDAAAARVMDEIGDALDGAFRRNGWK